MYKAFGNYVDIHPELRGINPIFNNIEKFTSHPTDSDIIGSLEKAGNIHKEVRHFLQPYLRPGIKLIDIAKLIELKTIELSDAKSSINRGIGFPVGLSVNNCAAHWHPNSSNKTVLNPHDIIKIDFGTEVNGWICDSAFTICFDSKFDNLMLAVKEATETGIKNIGVDVDIGDWGKSIQEVMESYEVTIDGTTHPIKAISNLGGHNIVKGVIHGGTFLPSVDMKSSLPTNYRFKEGVHAVETFGSTTDNVVSDVGECTLYRLNPDYLSMDTPTKFVQVNDLFKTIKSQFKTLPFTDRYIESFYQHKSCLKVLANNKIIHCYPPLCVGGQGYTAQYEHTVYIGSSKKIVFSRGEDY